MDSESDDLAFLESMSPQELDDYLDGKLRFHLSYVAAYDGQR